MKLGVVQRGSDRFSPPVTTYSFTPFELGEYLLYGMSPVPFSILCTPPAEPGRVRVHGKGLRGGVVSVPAQFIIDTREAGHGPLGVSIVGPEEVPIHCLDNYDGTCLCSFLPTTPGSYTIHVTFDDRVIPGSPFMSLIKPKQNSHVKNLRPDQAPASGTPFVFECGLPNSLKCCMNLWDLIRLS